MDKLQENVIEWITGDDTATVTLSQRKHITRFKKLAKEFPQTVQILYENSDGSITGHIPLGAISFNRLALKNKGISPNSEDENITREDIKDIAD